MVPETSLATQQLPTINDTYQSSLSGIITSSSASASPNPRVISTRSRSSSASSFSSSSSRGPAAPLTGYAMASSLAKVTLDTLASGTSTAVSGVGYALKFSGRFLSDLVSSARSMETNILQTQELENTLDRQLEKIEGEAGPGCCRAGVNSSPAAPG